MSPPYACPVCDLVGLNVRPYPTWPPLPGVILAPPYFDQLARESYEVCARCGFEFGFDDSPGGDMPGDSFESYREERIAEVSVVRPRARAGSRSGCS